MQNTALFPGLVLTFPNHTVLKRRAGKASRYWPGASPVRRLKTSMKYFGSA